MISKKRIAIVDPEKCDPGRCALECIKACPMNRTGAECAVIDQRIKVLGNVKDIAVIDENLCSGCGICVKRCPLKAITIINLPHELEQPLHQYGQNSFRVYNFPSPKTGVVGLIGPNGIGKSTLLNIMTGNMIPNMGKYDEEPDWNKVLEQYRGTDLHQYFEALATKKTRLSYKPQDISRIPKFFNGTVRELLAKVDETKQSAQMIKDLELTSCLDNKITEVSGGELQRVAIIAAICKDVDYYFFDEPSTYLDVKQRLNMARVIKKLGETKKVIVVEHDLAILDYLADYVQVMYGTPGAYGIVSTLKNARVGINEFLDGFLKAENTRIRAESIRFEVKPPTEAWSAKMKYSYPAFHKKYPHFQLTAEAGTLAKGEVVGILGPNAIGKTTFMKILAGEEKADEGKVNFNAKISYKPQYIVFEGDDTVAEYIRKQKDIDQELFTSEISRIVEDLMEKKVSKLSGGESQRFSIAMSLAKQCEVALLDEPSAYLDVEQRFRLSGVIKRITTNKEITTMVIDHDILFQDLVSNRMMVFSGEPGVKGIVGQAKGMGEGMNDFLKEMNLTFRREPDSGRPRMNKEGSQMDQEQKRNNQYYYVM